MKRYVKELANDKIRHLNGMRDDVKRANAEYINKVVRMCQQGFISDFEAVHKILQTIGV